MLLRPPSRLVVLRCVVLLVCLCLLPACTQAAPTADPTSTPTPTPVPRDPDGRFVSPKNNPTGTLGLDCKLQFQLAECGKQLVCIDGICSYCQNTTQCESPQTVCRPVRDAGGSICAHKSLFPHFNGPDFFGTFLAFIAASLAAAGGIGGGGLYVGLFILLAQFPTQTAIPLSKATIFGGSIATFIKNFGQRHPVVNRPLINYDAAFVGEPLTMAATILGVFLNVVFPTWLIVFLLTTTLAVASWRTFKHFRELHRQESSPDWVHFARDELATEAERHDLLSPSAAHPFADSDEDDDDDDLLHDDGGIRTMALHEGDDEQGRAGAKNLFREEQFAVHQMIFKESKTAWDKIALLVFVWFFVLFVSLSNGGHAMPSILGIKSCTWEYWSVIFSVLPFVLLATAWAARRLHSDFENKVRLRYPFPEGDIHWTIDNILLYCMYSFVAGIMAGLLGIEDALIKSPLLLHMGMNPYIVAPTTSFMILFTASATTLQYLVLGLLPYDYGFWYTCVGFAGALTGKTIMNWLIKKHRKLSYITMVISIVLSVSFVLMAITGINEVSDDITAGRSLGLSRFC